MKNPGTELIPYQADWGAVYPDKQSPDKVYATNYWASSDVRKKLQALSSNTDYFTPEEQGYMLSSQIKTLDGRKLYLHEHKKAIETNPENPDGYDFIYEENGQMHSDFSIKPGEHDYFESFNNGQQLQVSVKGSDLYYTTQDVLYAPYADLENVAPTVGSGGATSITTSEPTLPIGRSFITEAFWTRSPSTDYIYFDSGSTGIYAYRDHVIHRNRPLYAGRGYQQDGDDIGGSGDGDTGRYGSVYNAANGTVASVQPAFQMDATKLLFGSRVPRITENHENGTSVQAHDAMTLRYEEALGDIKLVCENIDGEEKIFLEVSNLLTQEQLAEKGLSKISLVVQTEGYTNDWDSLGADGWTIDATNGMRVLPEDITIDGKTLEEYNGPAGVSGVPFLNCQIWLEATDLDGRITYATTPVVERRYHVDATHKNHVNKVDDGVSENQIVNEGEAITDIVYQADSGLSFPTDYDFEENILGNIPTGTAINGISLQFNEDRTKATITGVPTAYLTQVTMPSLNMPPTIQVEDKTLYVGQNRDDELQKILASVEASDDEDGVFSQQDIKVEPLAEIPVDNDGNLTTAGTYKVKYSVTDQGVEVGNKDNKKRMWQATAEKTITITVKGIPPITGVSNGNKGLGPMLFAGFGILVISFMIVEILHVKKRLR